MKVNREAYVEAREIIEESLSFPEFYAEHADTDYDLESTALVPCVLHDESQSSFKYFPETDSFYCFGCNAGGSVVDFYYHLVKRNYPGMTKSKAVVELARLYNIRIPNVYDESYVDESKIFEEVPKKRNLGDMKDMSVNALRSYIDEELTKMDRSQEYMDLVYLVDTVDLVAKDPREYYWDIIEKLDGAKN